MLTCGQTGSWQRCWPRHFWGFLRGCCLLKKHKQLDTLKVNKMKLNIANMVNHSTNCPLVWHDQFEICSIILQLIHFTAKSETNLLITVTPPLSCLIKESQFQQTAESPVVDHTTPHTLERVTKGFSCQSLRAECCHTLSHLKKWVHGEWMSLHVALWAAAWRNE